MSVFDKPYWQTWQAWLGASVFAGLWTLLILTVRPHPVVTLPRFLGGWVLSMGVMLLVQGGLWLYWRTRR